MSEAAALAGRRVLVTGAAGFIGHHLVDALADGGAEVHGVGRQRDDAGRVRHEVDLRDGAAAERLVADVEPEAIVHLASYVSGDRSLSAVVRSLEDTLLPAVRLMVAAAERGVGRVLVAGSMEEPGPADPATVAPVSAYAAAKWAVSAHARLLHELHGLPVVNLRYFMVYGPGQRDRTKLVPQTIDRLRAGTPVTIGSGTRQVDWIHVDDVVAATLHALVEPGLEGATLDVGTGRLATTRDVVERLRDAIDPGATIEVGALPDRPQERAPVAARVEETERVLGWRAAWTLEAGLADTARRDTGAGASA